jgi:hypothetical protein
MKAPTRRQTVRAANERALSNMANIQPSADGYIGRILWWNLHDTWQWPCADVHEVLERHDLDPVTVLAEVTDFNKAFGHAITSVRAAVLSLGYKIEDAAPGPGKERRVAVCKIQRNGIVSLDANQEIVACPKDGTRPYVEVDGPTGIAQQLLSKTLSLVGNYKTVDLAQAIAKMIRKWSGVMCVRGVYFMPPGGETEIENLRAALREMGAGTIGRFVGNSANPESVESCAENVNFGLEEQLNAFAKEAEAYASKTDTTRASTIEGSLERVKALKIRADLCRTILGAAVSGIDDRVASVEKALRETLGVVEAR